MLLVLTASTGDLRHTGDVLGQRTCASITRMLELVSIHRLLWLRR